MITPHFVVRYAECYPGLAEMYDATGDSDDEADYTKMDMGNKKGPVGRYVLTNNLSQKINSTLNLYLVWKF